MFCSRKLNHRINHIHERALRIVYNDYSSTFEDLLNKDNTVTIHERNIQKLAVELYKIVNNLAPKIMHEVISLKVMTRYPRESIFLTRNIKSVKFGEDTIAHLGPKIWNIIPESIKDEPTLIGFTKKIKQWKPTTCPCRLCKRYVSVVGFFS